jgi:hypothetical protein
VGRRPAILAFVQGLLAAIFLGTAGLLLGSAFGHRDCGERMPGWGLVPGGALVGLAVGGAVLSRLGARGNNRFLGAGVLALPIAVWVHIAIGFRYGDEGACWSSWGAAWNDAWFCALLAALGLVALGGAIREVGAARSRLRSGP